MDRTFKEFNKKKAFELLDRWIPEEQEKLKAIKTQITKLKSKKTNLIDLRLEWEIDKNIYNERLNSITFEINSLENQEKEISNRKDIKKIKDGVELACSLYESYKLKDFDEKSEWLRNNKVELFLDTKKELSIGNNSFLSFINFLNFRNGGAEHTSKFKIIG
jgi:hypothetical protein